MHLFVAVVRLLYPHVCICIRIQSEPCLHMPACIIYHATTLTRIACMHAFILAMHARVEYDISRIPHICITMCASILQLMFSFHFLCVQQDRRCQNASTITTHSIQTTAAQRSKEEQREQNKKKSKKGIQIRPY